MCLLNFNNIIRTTETGSTSPSFHGNISHPIVKIAVSFYQKALFSYLINLASKHQHGTKLPVHTVKDKESVWKKTEEEISNGFAVGDCAGFG